MTEIVVSRRDGILTAPDGTKHRVARGKTLADAEHPAVLANPGDWVPMVVTLTVGDRPEGAGELDTPLGVQHEQVAQLENDVAELEETLAQRDAELTRLAEGLGARGIELPADDEREPGWLVDLVLRLVDERASARSSLPREPQSSPAPAAAPSIAPPKPRKRTAPPLVTRTGDDG